jgi:ribosomal protein S18 acetylase RimI-like enzyme
MEPITIRKATIEDLPAVREICKITCTDPYLLEHLKTLYLLYADYYLNEEQGHCFVALAKGKVIGYILSSFDQALFNRTMKSKYLPVLKASDPRSYRLEKAFLFATLFWKSYRAHLHIDILPAYQHQGIGSRLMENLVAALRLNHVKRVYLAVSSSHRNAVAFYRKNHFKTLYHVSGSYVLGRKL